MKNITATHCQACGSTDPQDVGFEALRAGDGYTACCNERAIYPEPAGGTEWWSGRPARPETCDTRGDCSHE
jgi:hypothetical protein